MSIAIDYDDGLPHTSVEVAGEFTDWQRAPLGLARNTESHYAAVFEHAKPGASYMYKFIVDGRWTLLPGRSVATDAIGNENHVAIATEDAEVVAAPNVSESPVGVVSKESSPVSTKDSKQPLPFSPTEENGQDGSATSDKSSGVTATGVVALALVFFLAYWVM